MAMKPVVAKAALVVALALAAGAGAVDSIGEAGPAAVQSGGEGLSENVDYPGKLHTETEEAVEGGAEDGKGGEVEKTKEGKERKRVWLRVRLDEIPPWTSWGWGADTSYLRRIGADVDLDGRGVGPRGEDGDEFPPRLDGEGR
ncbi:hypothetical protein ACHAWF_017023 [Thalassiosira exigua]